jgi:hypothetical protein
MNKANSQQRNHPSRASILAALNGSATERESQSIREHLIGCSQCEAFAQQSKLLLTDLLQYANSMPRQETSHVRPSWHAWWPSRRSWVSAMAVATAFLIASSLPDGVPNIQASELLQRAEKAEESRQHEATPLHHLYRFLDAKSGTTCRVAAVAWQTVADHSSGSCDGMQRLFLNTKWSIQEPLSVHTYRQWRDSLAVHRDSVFAGQLYSIVRTETSQGNIAAASLKVLNFSYKPVELRLEFTDSRAISVETDDSAPAESITTANRTTQPIETPNLNGANKLDQAEVRAWQAVHTVGADTGWEAAVARIGKSVVVIDSSSEASRRQQLQDALLQNAEQKIEFQDAASYRMNSPSFWPQRAVTGTSIPLAEGLLEEHFPNAAERSRFVTELSTASKRVVGFAFESERIRERQKALRACPCSANLDALLRDDGTRLAQEFQKEITLLSQALGPMQRSETKRVLSYREARELDLELESLFNAAEDSSSENRREQMIEKVRHLVSSRYSSP